MSNQETRATTGRYAPSVHYSQHAPQPISQQLHTKPSNIKEPNWGETIASLADTAGKVYLKAREQDIKTEATKAIDTAKTDLARKANAIAEEQRQTGMSASAAASRYRMLADSALSSGMNEKDVADVIGRYDGGILNIDQSRQQKIMEADQKYFETQAQDVADRNASLGRLQPSDRIKFLMEQRTLVDDVNSLRRTIGAMPEGPEKESAKTLLQGKISSNVRANMVIQLGNMFANQNPLTESDWIALRTQGIDACVANGIDRGTAGVLVDEIAASYSITGDLTDIKRYFKDNATYMEAANKNILANANNTYLSMPGMALLTAMPQELQKKALIQNWALYDTLTKPFMAKVSKNKKTGEVTVEGLDRITPQLVGPLAQAVNNMNSSGMYNDYVRGKTTGIVLSKVNEINQLTPMSSASDASVVALNSDGTRQFIDFRLARRQAENLTRSEDPEESATGQWLLGQLDNAEEQEWLSKNIPVADKMVKVFTNDNGGDIDAKRANTSLQRSTNAASLRFDADGKLFISDADRSTLAELGLAFDKAMPFGGEYKEELDLVNSKLETLDPKMRKLVLIRLGYKEAAEGELPLSASFETIKLFDSKDIKNAFSSAGERHKQYVEDLKASKEPNVVSFEESGKGIEKSVKDIWEGVKGDTKGDVENAIRMGRAVKDAFSLEGKFDSTPFGQVLGLPASERAVEIEKLEKTLEDKDLKPHIRRAVEGTIEILKNRDGTATARLSRSEPIVNAHMDYSDMEIGKLVKAKTESEEKMMKEVNKGTDEYDTKLGSYMEKSQYDAWLQSLKDQGFSTSTKDYDLRGAFLAGVELGENGHLPDTFKKPNHITFSKESKYYKDGMWAGEWTEEGDFMIPLTTPKAKLAKLKNYFAKYEPDAMIVINNPKVLKQLEEVEAEEDRLSEYLSTENLSISEAEHYEKEKEELVNKRHRLWKLVYIQPWE